MPKTKQRNRKVSLHKCQQCQKTFESNRSDSKTCSVRCRQVRHQQELAKRVLSYGISTVGQLKAGIVDVLPKMVSRYDKDGQLWVDFDWTMIPQRQKDLMEAYALAESVSLDTLEDDFSKIILENLGLEIGLDKAKRDAQEDLERRAAEIAELKAIVANQPARDAADQEAMQEAARTGQPFKFGRV